MTQREAQAAATKDRLVGIARRLFTEHGYDGTSTSMVLAEAGLARGALYHHFPDKRALLRAAFEDVERDLVEGVVAQSYADPRRPLWERLQIGIRAFLAGASAPDVQRISLTDAPAVLGRAEWRALDEGYGLGQLARVLRQGMAEGLFPAQPVEPLARLLIAVLYEGASEIARSPDRERALEEMSATIIDIFDRLRAHPATSDASTA
jgi:AcrR family transcriptional regulator